MNASLDNLVYLQAGDWEAYVLPAFGSNLISLSCQGQAILRTPRDLSALVASPVLFGMPILMPPNRTAGGHFRFDGKDWQLPVNEITSNNHLHGFICKAPFTIQEKARQQLTCTLYNDGSLYPFPCRLTCRIALGPDGLDHRLTITNTGRAAMPLVLGYHTNFHRPQCFQVPIARRWETDQNHIPTGKLLELDAQEQSWRTGCKLDGQRITGFFQAAGRTALIDRVEYTVGEPFDQWILYNGNGDQDFLSVEPQIGPVNSLNQPGSYPILQPDQEIDLISKVKCRNMGQLCN
jgi:aldose 1-epimerase